MTLLALWLVRISFRKLKDLDESERQRQDELDVKTLQILRALVHNEIVNIDPQLHEDDPTGYRRRCTNKVQPVQNKLQGFGNAMSRVSEGEYLVIHMYNVCYSHTGYRLYLSYHIQMMR